MPSIEVNHALWGETYGWYTAGDEWSEPWGNSQALWDAVLYPRICPFLPTGPIMEIAPGFGRWTERLLPLGKKLIAVDLNRTCVDACAKRFSSARNLELHVNDGKSLEMIPDESINFVFSFDSLVHAVIDVMSSY